MLSWSRDELLEQYAQWVLESQQVTETVAASRVDDSQLERERWKHEEKLKELKLKLIRAQMKRFQEQNCVRLFRLITRMRPLNSNDMVRL